MPHRGRQSLRAHPRDPQAGTGGRRFRCCCPCLWPHWKPEQVRSKRFGAWNAVCPCVLPSVSPRDVLLLSKSGLHRAGGGEVVHGFISPSFLFTKQSWAHTSLAHAPAHCQRAPCGPMPGALRCPEVQNPLALKPEETGTLREPPYSQRHCYPFSTPWRGQSLQAQSCPSGDIPAGTQLLHGVEGFTPAAAPTPGAFSTPSCRHSPAHR